MKLSSEQLEYFKLLNGCPHGEPKHNCPLQKYRDLPLIEKYKMSLRPDMDILHHSRNCSMVRDGRKQLEIMRLVKEVESQLDAEEQEKKEQEKKEKEK